MSIKLKHTSCFITSLIILTELNDYLGNIVGFTNDGHGLGLSTDGSVYMCSVDHGYDWYICDVTEYTNITTDGTYTTATPIPFNDFRSISPQTMFITYGYTTSTLNKVTGILLNTMTHHMIYHMLS